MYYLYCLPGKEPKIRVDFRQHSAEAFSVQQRRASIRLAGSVELVNIWLATLTANVNYETTTVHEYGKVLCSTLNWLALEPVQLATATPVGKTLLHLSKADTNALLAWFTVPAKEEYNRQTLAKSGVLPPTYRSHKLSASTNNLRVAALTNFYHSVSAKCEEGKTIVVNPLRSQMLAFSDCVRVKCSVKMSANGSEHHTEPRRTETTDRAECGPGWAVDGGRSCREPRLVRSTGATGIGRLSEGGSGHPRPWQPGTPTRPYHASGSSRAGDHVGTDDLCRLQPAASARSAGGARGICALAGHGASAAGPRGAAGPSEPASAAASPTAAAPEPGGPTGADRWESACVAAGAGACRHAAGGD